MNKKRILGFSLVLIGAVLIITSQTQILGAVIGLNQISSSVGLIVGLVFVGVGTLLFFAQKGNYAQKILDDRKYVDKTNELKSVARDMGYKLDPGYNEGTRVYKDNQVITVIPNHRTVSRGVSQSILEALATGLPNFRRRNR